MTSFDNTPENNEQIQPSSTGYQLTQKDFNQINRRSLLFYQLGWNYERMQGSGYLFIILPQLRKIYGDDSPELKEMMKIHSQFFNTSNFFNTIITGIDLAMEEEEQYKAKDTVKGMKVGLMGSFAAVGDSLFASLIPTIFGALAGNMAQQGNPVGALIWIFATVAIVIFRWKQLGYAYKEGVSLVTTMQHRLETLTNAATLLGVFMVGALVASIVKVEFAWKPTIGDVTIDIQENVDMILPKLLPLIIALSIYWLLGRKHMNATRAIFIVLIVSIILSALGIITPS
ncbi:MULTISPECIES: PTS system mannose/fructose/sorbose family transporter subunit IID [Mammaliicoccus]|uniref:PTS system mannose/fructose/sorbose family transporter subunit IID n=2 Tax=Bacilli TaxID=91061 RepID=A0ABS6GZP4_MAMLE|nr:MULTISPECIES: PTS system mannose/fructose/sorbose family transporter subunit IID [Mammaliicoccus]HIS18705.1 PTS system mannose/fructose/sorbose family transporter subunit IID [Candidatus Coprovivens excrementavium]MBF0748743.1 PTS system mannose/fructose/sorbose family transporter subunit IID [Mammaliicoccus lentus]MBF0841144.1 PTS system mannose/fructose/sorbose family transporter subunit IID [Mammaliicoccus lentus]MBU6113973.1 PTS system mannose/fructose/sorbose family transporter subunit 